LCVCSYAEGWPASDLSSVCPVHADGGTTGHGRAIMSKPSPTSTPHCTALSSNLPRRWRN
jgi:hypothetical protein